MDDLKTFVALACERPLDSVEAEAAFATIMEGNATDAQIGGFLAALRTRGETVTEYAAAAKVMRSKCRPVKAPEGAIDIVGTGGDGKGTLNISTATAIAVAAAGVPVAKHGNRSLSSKSGAADVLSRLGVNVMAEPEIVEKAIDEIGIGFMMAPVHHPAMRHVMKARTELGTRTVFNILGPLTNPAGAKICLIGAFSKRLIRPMAETFRALKTERTWVVHGRDGTDEISICERTDVVSLEMDEITEFDIGPEDAGLPRHSEDSIKGGTPEENCEALKAVLAGEKSAYRDAVLLNSAAALMLAGETTSLKEGANLAMAALDSGRARDLAEALARITNSEP